MFDDWDEQEAMLGPLLVPPTGTEALDAFQADMEQARLRAERERAFHRSQPSYQDAED